MEDYQDRLRIRTPEGISLDLVLAGLGSRFTATLIDLTIKGALVLVALLIARAAGDLGVGLAAVLVFAIYFGYDIAFETLSGGRTPGKRWTGLRVLRDDGRPVDLLASAIRNVMRVIDGLPLSYVPAMVSVLVTRRNQRLGDLAASTIVVRDARRPPTAAPVAPSRPTYHGFALPHGVDPAVPRPAPPSRGPLDVSAVSPQDLLAVRSFLGRRTDLAPAVREDLARRIAAALAPRVGGAIEHLSDEQLLEAVVASKDGSP